MHGACQRGLERHHANDVHCQRQDCGENKRFASAPLAVSLVLGGGRHWSDGSAGCNWQGAEGIVSAGGIFNFADPVPDKLWRQQ